MPATKEEIEDLIGAPAPKPSKHTPAALSDAAAALLGDGKVTPHIKKAPQERPRAAVHDMLDNSAPSEVLLKQFLQKMGDKMWRMKSGMYLILTENGGTEPFKLRHEQESFLTNRHYRNFVPKARKLGMSTLIVLDYLDDCLFNRDFRCGVIDLKQSDAEDKLAIARFAWDKGLEHPNPEFRALWSLIHKRNPMVDATKSKLSWKNGSMYSAGVRYTGKTPRKLHCSEFGPIAAQFPRVAEDIVRGSFNSIPMGGTIDIETTMEGGRIGECYKIFKLALKAAGYAELTELDWKCHFFSWMGHPSYHLPFSTEEGLNGRTREYFAKLEAEHGAWLKETFGWDKVPISRKAWWQKKQETLGDFMWQQFPSVVGECDMASVVGQIYPEFTKLRAEGRVAAFNPEPHIPFIVSCDLGSSANTAMWLIQPAGHQTNWVDCAFGEGAGAAWVAEKMRQWEQKYGFIVQLLIPHDARITDKGSGLTYEQQLVKAGVPQTKITVVPRTPDVWAGIDETRKLWANSWFHIRCDEVVRDADGNEQPSGVARLEGYRCKPPGPTGEVKNTPMHDICSHAADGARTFGEAKGGHLVRFDVHTAGGIRDNVPEWWGDSPSRKVKVKMVTAL